MTTRLHAYDKHSWKETIWEALHGYRENCIPEGGDPAYDEQWNDICSAMAYIQEELGVPEIVDNAEADPQEIAGNAEDKNNTDVVSVDVGSFNVCIDVEHGNLQIRVYPRDKKGQLWDHPCDTFDVDPQEIEPEAEGQ
jgi:hypothetical protein